MAKFEFIMVHTPILTSFSVDIHFNHIESRKENKNFGKHYFSRYGLWKFAKNYISE